MEKLVSIVQQLPLVERPYTDYDDKNGQKRWLTEVKIVKLA